MSSRSNGVTKVEFSRDRIAWVSRSPSCSQSVRRLAFISGSTKSSTMSSNSLAASARLSPAASKRSKNDSSRGKIRSFTPILPRRRATAKKLAAVLAGCRQQFTAPLPAHHPVQALPHGGRGGVDLAVLPTGTSDATRETGLNWQKRDL